MIVLVSRCLCGVPCRYHGRQMPVHSRVQRLIDAGHTIVDICPEVAGGLPVPRPPTRIRDGRLICDGVDVTEDFARGARHAVRIAAACGANKAYMVKGSPSCDRDHGVAALALAAAGVRVIRV